VSSRAGKEPSGRSRLSDEAVQRAMGGVLRAGVMVAAVLVAAGGLHLLVVRGDSAVRFGTFTGTPPAWRDPVQIVRGAWALRPGDLIQLGLLVLVLTPVARVVFSAVVFLLQRDRLYVVLTGIVLVVLALSLTGHTP
jgi:uncharacterized membrane protein